MKRFKIILTTIIVLGAIVAVLLYNKSKMEAKSKPDIASAIPVSVTTVTKSTVTNSHSLVGTIVANNDVAIVSETQGKVTAVYCKVGDYKQAGSVLFQIDDELKQAGFTAAEVNYEKAKKDFERFQSLQKQQAVTDQQFETARLAFKSAEAQYIVAKRQLEDTKIKTPISGIVSARNIDLGTMVQNANVVANVVDISRLKVKLNIAEKDAFILKVGDKVDIITDVYPGVKFEGNVSSISSKADEAHTYPVEISLENSSAHPLKAGMFGRISLTSLTNDEALVIPRQALLGSMKDPQVFTIENNIAKLRRIVVIGEIGENLAVSSGLNEGETVVINGQNNLKDNTQVSIIQ